MNNRKNQGGFAMAAMFVAAGAIAWAGQNVQQSEQSVAAAKERQSNMHEDQMYAQQPTMGADVDPLWDE